MRNMQTQGVAVITGASSGIGAALARRLGQKGFRLVLGARRGDALRALSNEIPSDTLPVVTDVTRRADVERLRDEAIHAFGSVDIWVNNAGRGINASVLELTDEQFDLMMAVNVKSALYGMQAIVPHFKDRGGGHLINVSTFLSRVPVATYRSAYNAAKAALNSLTANLRMDLRREYPGINVSLVMPGMVTTEFARNALGGTPAVTWASHPGGGGPQVQTADDAAAAIESLIDSPREEIYTQRGQPDTVVRYFQDVGAFERGLG
ncbi:MAG TPA: SDR family oxidoreductase [Gemmatimonadaceae bacterium]|jgi:NADP-dependent 3-hydroxy acid dehydrogenase YdfG